MAESSSGQDEANPAFWLAAWAGKVGPSCLLRKSCVVIPTSKSSLSGHVINRSSLFSQDSWILASQKVLGQYPAVLNKHWSVTHNYLEQWLNFANIFSKRAFYIAFKGLCYAIFCSLRSLNVSWHKLNFRNNGPVLLFTALSQRCELLSWKAAGSQLNFLLLSIIITITSNEPMNHVTETHKSDRNQPITNHELLNPLSSVC